MMMFEKNNKSQREGKKGICQTNGKIIVSFSFAFVLQVLRYKVRKIFHIFIVCELFKRSFVFFVLISRVCLQGNIVEKRKKTELKLSRDPSKYSRELFHVKQIFMFIFCLKFMKQYAQNTLFDINDFDCKCFIGSTAFPKT
jgi:hypothetical protein